MKSIGFLPLFLNLLILNHGLLAIAVSPKLDFGQSEVVEVKKEIKTGKIKGLRVTVESSELKESKSSNSDSSASSDSSENKKTVGVRTDVTFEITSGETNDTKTVDEKEIGKEDDNASIPVVPVFKGTSDRRENPASSAPPVRRPVFTDNRNFYGNADRENEHGWKQSIPQYAIWTTERYNRRFDQPPPVFHHRGSSGNNQFDIFRKPSNFIPYHIHHSGHHHHVPCTCKEYPGPSLDEHVFKPQTNKVDDKLEKPFSKTSSSSR
ncbi:hypothetical protein PVAND_004738 [Polypedilum vanderplanki]|uniref:Uncharacterized protein n=1 Tax=Polypedilum vanderplanki TaxID=319348 RepID=A0A9J6C010_POLVA|nr:hypothetical protein PVAND_004738 [Polypedilum vanderplanki]